MAESLDAQLLTDVLKENEGCSSVKVVAAELVPLKTTGLGGELF